MTTGPRPKLLVIEDDPDFAEVILRIADRLGWESQHATHGLEALHEVTAFEPDVVTLDWKLPDKGGEDVLRWIRTHWRRATIVVLSAYAEEPGVRQTALALGAFRVVGKPLRQKALHQLLRQAEAA